jgi:hypothetical protein
VQREVKDATNEKEIQKVQSNGKFSDFDFFP